MKTFREYLNEGVVLKKDTKNAPIWQSKSTWDEESSHTGEEDHVHKLEKGLKKLDNHDYDTIHNLMMDVCKYHKISGKELHNDFKLKHGKTPDQWIKELNESAAWRRKEGKSDSGGLNAKGVASYRKENPGSKLKMAVTGKVKPGSKAAKRRKSFCARMSGMKGPMKKPDGSPTRKALSLRKWKCR